MPSNHGWTKDIKRRHREIDFTLNDKPGVNGVTLEDDPTDVFLNLMEEVLKLFEKCSNDKHKELNEGKQKKLREVTKNDILCFLSAIIWMDTRKLPTTREYYCKDDY